MNDTEQKPLTATLPEQPATSPAAYKAQPDELHDLFEIANFNHDEEDPLAALRNDPNYAALIRDLEYIATQARALFSPSEETPSDQVWENIKSGMEQKPSDA